MGCLRIGVATPWDDCPYGKSNANTFAVLVLIGFFLTSCVGMNLGDIPSVDPSTLGWTTLYTLAFLKYCYNTKSSGSYESAPCLFFRNAPKGYGRCIDHLIYAEQIISCLNFPIIAMQGRRASEGTVLHTFTKSCCSTKLKYIDSEKSMCYVALTLTRRVAARSSRHVVSHNPWPTYLTIPVPLS